MAETLIWCCKGFRESIEDSLAIATFHKRKGDDVAVLFDEGALVALAENKFEWSPVLKNYANTIPQNKREMGYDSEMADYIKGVIAAEVPIYAFAGWAGFLGVTDKLPPWLKLIEPADVGNLITQAKKIIGGP